MGVLAVLVIVPMMLFVWLLVELARSSAKIKRLETENELKDKRYDGLVAEITLISKKDALEMTPYVYALAKKLNSR